MMPMPTPVQPADAIGVDAFYERLFRDAVDAVRADLYLQLTVFGAEAVPPLTRIAAELGMRVESETHQHPNRDRETFGVVRLIIPPKNATITVHLPSVVRP